jgi:hypothetical protein
MISSLDILSILSDKNNFERFSPYVKEHLVGKEAWMIIKDLADFYNKHDVMCWDTFSTWFFMVKHPMFNAEKVEVYRSIFDRVKAHEINKELSEQLVEHFIQKDYATKIGEAALSIAEDSAQFKMEDIVRLWEEYEVELDVSSDLESFLVTEDPEEILSTTSSESGLHWRLKPLQEALGSIRRGHFIVFGAYVNSGKTTMLASEVVNFAAQLPEDEYVLWYNNEEDGATVRKRIQQSATGMTTREMEANPQKFINAVRSHPSFGKIKMLDKGVLYTNEMERLMKKYKPGLIIIDQLWKAHFPGKSSENEVTRIGMMFNWGREMAKKYCPVITVHQADGSAAGQLWIEMNQLYMSKVALQGEMDAVVTLGKSLEPGYENIRGLYTPKNKLMGRDGFKALIKLDAERARYDVPTEEAEL